MDLSKYFYLSREALVSSDNLVATFTENERKLLSSIKNCIQGQEDTRFKELSDLQSESQSRIVDALLLQFENDELELRVVRRIFTNYPHAQAKIVEILKGKKKEFYSMGIIPHFTAMHKSNDSMIEQLLNALVLAKKLTNEMKTQILQVHRKV